jgi:putative flippase GtrA
VLSKKFVFRSNGRYVAESIRYLGAFITSFLFNLAMLKLALDYWNFDVVVEQLIAISSYTSLMFVLSRFVVFVAPEPGLGPGSGPG